jgi:hypothetical protein
LAALDRSYWLAVAVIAYLSVASLQGTGSLWLRLLPVLLSPFVLAWLWSRTARAPTTAEVDPSAQKALRLCVAAALVWLQSRIGSDQQGALEFASTLSAGACAVAAAFALARIPSRPGLLQPPKASLSIDAAAFVGMLWAVVATIAAARTLVPASTLPIDPLALDYAQTAASIGSILVLIAAAWRLRVLRKLELGVADRAAGALALTITTLSVAIPVAAIDIAPPDRALPAAVVLASLCCIWTVVISDASKVSSTLRGTLAVMILGVPTAMITAVLSKNAPHHAGAVALAGSAAALVVGLIARELAKPLGPEQSRWLSAIAEASQNALVPEPRAAIVATLQALKKTATSPKARPELWRLDPPSVISVDVAGYLDERAAEVPLRICELGADEPELTLRAETLAALQVRRPDVRDLLEWFEVRAAFSATVISDEDGPIGFLLLPRGDRSSTLTLEEAQAVRRLAERVSSLFGVTAALARAQKREAEASDRAAHLEAEYERLKLVTQGSAARNRAFARNLSSPLRGAAYSAAARLAIAELQRLSQQREPVFLETPLGVNATPWAAYCHSEGPSGDGPFVVVDGALEGGAARAVWDDPERSPSDLARGGSLFILDTHLSPPKQQDALARAWTLQANEASEIPPARLIVSSPYSAEDLVRRGLLTPALSSLVGRTALVIPALAERPEDLRAMILELASRTRVGVDCAPLGVDRQALQALLDHQWPGNETELSDVVSRACQLCSGPRLALEDLQAIGFAPLEATTNPFADRFEPRSYAPSYRPAPDHAEPVGGAPGVEGTRARGEEKRVVRGASQPSQPPPEPTQGVRRRSRAPRPRRRG